MIEANLPRPESRPVLPAPRARAIAPINAKKTRNAARICQPRTAWVLVAVIARRSARIEFPSTSAGREKYGSQSCGLTTTARIPDVNHALAEYGRPSVA